MVSLSITTSGIVDGQVGDAVDFTTPLNELRVHIENTLNGVQAFDAVTVGIAEALTIASGVITAAKTHVVVDTEGAAATDDLDTINSPAEGKIIFLRIANTGRTVRLRHGAGNLRTTTGKHFTLDTTEMVVQLTGTAATWLVSTVPAQTINLGGVASSTLSGGAFTKTRTTHQLIPSSGTYDTLTTINGGQDGDILIIRPQPGMAIRVQNGAALALSGGRDRWLSSSDRSLMLHFSNNVWRDVSPTNHLTPRPGFRNWWREKAAAATYEATGIASGTNAGAGAVTNANAADGTFVSQAIAASSGTFGGRRSTTFNLTRRAHEPVFTAVIKTGSPVTNLRLWVGLFSAMVTNVDTIAAGTQAAAFRFSTVAGDVTWRGICNDGTTQSSAVDSGVAVAENTKYKLTLRFTGSAVGFSINDDVEFFVTTNLPATTTDLGFVVTAITTTNSAKSLDISDIYCEYLG